MNTRWLSCCWLVACLTSQQHACVSQGRICLTSQQHACVSQGRICLTSQQHACVSQGRIYLTSQQHACVSQGRIYSDKITCCHTEIEVADQTLYLTQSQYTDTRPTSHWNDSIGESSERSPILRSGGGRLTTTPSRSSSPAFPSSVSGAHHFGGNLCVCDHFLKSNH